MSSPVPLTYNADSLMMTHERNVPHHGEMIKIPPEYRAILVFCWTILVFLLCYLNILSSVYVLVVAEVTLNEELHQKFVKSLMNLPAVFTINHLL